MTPMEKESWAEYRNLVLHELERANARLDSIDGKVDAVRHDLIGLKVKMAMIGAVSGALISGLVSYVFPRR